jgi:hypothetical protein
MTVAELRNILSKYADDVEVDFMSHGVSYMIMGVGDRERVWSNYLSHFIFNSPEERKEYLDTLREHLDVKERMFGEKIVYIDGVYE